MRCLDEGKEDVWYCSEDHMLLHRTKNNNGEEICYPFKIMENDYLGRYHFIVNVRRMSLLTKYYILRFRLPLRYLVATRNIKAGEIIFEELPLVVAPNATSTPQCIVCHSKVMRYQ